VEPTVTDRAKVAGLVTVVIPVKDAPELLDRCLLAVRESGAATVVVVDDGSTDPEAHAEVAARHGATLLRSARSEGPGAARQRGIEWASTTLVACVDVDVVVPPGWFVRLLGHFADEKVALVAPRVRSASGTTRRERYEQTQSPLDLGEESGPIRAGSAISYVPSAALVMRRSAVLVCGGFDPSLRVGEDVDLVWRLGEAGWNCRYDARVSVVHDVRPDLAGLVAQRRAYGSSAAALYERHGSKVAPVRVDLRGAAAAVAIVTGAPGLPISAGLCAWSVAQLHRRLGPLGVPLQTSAQLVMSGVGGAGRQLSRAAVRPWFPLMMALALTRAGRSGIFRRVLLAIAVERMTRFFTAQSDLGPASWLALDLVDDLAYSVGVWSGCAEENSLGALLPEVRRAPSGPEL
jgi:mycofactocin system glycosyltransferase